MKIARILVIKFRNIGDVLLITPLIRNLKLNYPNALIDVAVNKGTEEMITLNPNINDIIIYDRSKIKSLNIFNKIYQEIKFALDIKRNDYDIVINTTKGDRGALLALLCNSNIKIGYKSKKNKFIQKIFTMNLPKIYLNHMVDIGLDSLKLLNLPIKEKKVEIFWSDSDQKIIEQILEKNDLVNKPFIHIHPVSRWMFKCNNDVTMAKIIDYCMIELEIPIVLTAAPLKHEMEKIETIQKLCKSNPLNLSGQLSLKQTTAINKKAICFIGVDTAIMHIAAANNIPVISFFGPSSAYHWGPWDNNYMTNKYKEKNGLQYMGKHMVIQESWKCIPCNKAGCNDSKISDCLINLDIKHVKIRLKEIISNGI